MKKFSEFSDEKILDGDKMKIEDVLNVEIKVIDSRLSSSKYVGKKCLTIQFELNNKKHVVFTGSDVLINQIEKYKNEIPFETTIRKINKYYTLT
jgi:hypothetical protein